MNVKESMPSHTTSKEFENTRLSWQGYQGYQGHHKVIKVCEKLCPR